MRTAIEQEFIDDIVNARYGIEPFKPQAAEPVGTIRPGAMEGEMRAIEQTGFERLLEKTGLTLEEFGKELDKLGSVKIGGVEITLRDIIPFVGYSDEGEQKGTPQALIKKGRGISMTTGTGLTTQLKEDTKQLVGDVVTTLPIAGTAKAAGKAIKKVRAK